MTTRESVSYKMTYYDLLSVSSLPRNQTSTSFIPYPTTNVMSKGHESERMDIVSSIVSCRVVEECRREAVVVVSRFLLNLKRCVFSSILSYMLKKGKKR